eukprot:COSAG05_NODE_24290_length_252_cov_1.000000_1_plen_25_part_10
MCQRHVYNTRKDATMPVLLQHDGEG